MQNANKLFKSKKGINDISIIAIILSIFLFTSVMIEFINAEFGIGADTFDRDNLETLTKADADSVSKISGFTILLTVLKLAIFDWGNTLGLPFWLDIMYVILAIIFVLVIARNIWIGGGG